MLGTSIGPYLEPGDWLVGASYRTFRADDQYQGTRLNPIVTKNGTSVISKMNLLDLGATYGLDRQWTLSVSLPVITYAGSNRALPSTTPGSPRFTQSTEGIGDLSIVARRWLFDTQQSSHGNVSLGVGFKAPTGNSNAMDRFPNGRGLDPQLRPVDPSIQPGDGGWGVLFDLQAFKQWQSFTFFANSVYLANPRGQNGTLSPRAFLAPGGPGAIAAFERFNTVADQYLGRLGVAYPVRGVKGLALTFAGRVEGTPQEDLFGQTVGFRRPGYAISVEPGLLYSRGNTNFTLSFPVRTHQNVQESPVGVPRDSTFAPFQIIAGVTHRLGKSRPASKPTQKPAEKSVGTGGN